MCFNSSLGGTIKMLQNFWDYAKNINKIASLDDVFSEWCNKLHIGISEAKVAWTDINRNLVRYKKSWWSLSDTDFVNAFQILTVELANEVAIAIDMLNFSSNPKVALSFTPEEIKQIVVRTLSQTQITENFIERAMNDLTVGLLVQEQNKNSGKDISAVDFDKLLNFESLKRIGIFLQSAAFVNPLSSEIAQNLLKGRTRQLRTMQTLNVLSREFGKWINGLVINYYNKFKINFVKTGLPKFQNPANLPGSEQAVPEQAVSGQPIPEQPVSEQVAPV